MSDFNLSAVDTTEKSFGPSKYITYGIQKLKINKMTIKVASTGSKQVIFNMEGSPVTEAGFEGIEGAQGPVGRVSTSYMKAEQEKDIMSILCKIADALEVREKLNAVAATSFEDLITKAEEVLCGKFANFSIATEQYWDPTGGKEKTGASKNSLRFPKYDYVEKVGTTPSKIKFDKNNSYHFKAAVVPSNIGTATSASKVKSEPNDLPF